MRKGRSYPVPALVVDVRAPQCLVMRIAIRLIAGTARSEVVGSVLRLSPVHALTVRDSPSNPVQRLGIGEVLGPTKRVVREHRVFDDLSVCKGREGTHLPTFARKSQRDQYLWCYVSPCSPLPNRVPYSSKAPKP